MWCDPGGRLTSVDVDIEERCQSVLVSTLFEDVIAVICLSLQSSTRYRLRLRLRFGLWFGLWNDRQRPASGRQILVHRARWLRVSQLQRQLTRAIDQNSRIDASTTILTRSRGALVHIDLAVLTFVCSHRFIATPAAHTIAAVLAWRHRHIVGRVDAHAAIQARAAPALVNVNGASSVRTWAIQDPSGVALALISRRLCPS